MKILNLYAGIGGNRRLWGDEHEITAVEYDENIAKFYAETFPNDNVIVADAHQFLLDHYKEYDFIWASPPCPTHSRLNYTLVGQGKPARYIDITLYQEIIFLKHWFKGKWVVENVVPYYEPLIPAQKSSRHLWWGNFTITDCQVSNYKNLISMELKDLQEYHGFDLSSVKGVNYYNKRKMLRNCVHPETGLHILNCALKENDNVENK